MPLLEEVTAETDISDVPPILSASISGALYSRKRPSKAIRVLTVVAYMLSVSLAAILLSIYYIFVWDGQASLALKASPQDGRASEEHRAVVNDTGSLSTRADGGFYGQDIINKETGPTTATLEEAEVDDENETPPPMHWMTVANKSWDELQRVLMPPQPTPDYEDAMLLSTAPSDENSTWYPDLEDYNSEFDMIDKESVLMSKLRGRY